MDDGIEQAEALLELSGFRVLDVVETEAEVVIRIETTEAREFCRRWGVRAGPQVRMGVDVRDLACVEPPARLVWIKRQRRRAARRGARRTRGPSTPITSTPRRC